MILFFWLYTRKSSHDMFCDIFCEIFFISDEILSEKVWLRLHRYSGEDDLDVYVSVFFIIIIVSEDDSSDDIDMMLAIIYADFYLIELREDRVERVLLCDRLLTARHDISDSECELSAKISEKSLRLYSGFWLDATDSIDSHKNENKKRLPESNLYGYLLETPVGFEPTALELCRLLQWTTLPWCHMNSCIIEKYQKKQEKDEDKKSLSFEREIYFFMVPKMGLRALRRAPALLVFEMPSVAFLMEPLGFKSHNYKKSLSFEREIYFFMVPKMGLEPTHPKAYAPQTYVSTIPPPGHLPFDQECMVRVPLSNVVPLRGDSFSEVWLRHHRLRSASSHIYHSTTWANFWQTKNDLEENPEAWFSSKLCAIELVHPVGFEPTTNGFEDRYSSNWAMGADFPTLEMPADYSKRKEKRKFISQIFRMLKLFLF